MCATSYINDSEQSAAWHAIWGLTNILEWTKNGLRTHGQLCVASDRKRGYVALGDLPKYKILAIDEI